MVMMQSRGDGAFECPKRGSVMLFSVLMLMQTAVGNIAVAQSDTPYIPREVQRAFEAGTRSPEGLPGGRYWQNHSEYKIAVTLDTANTEIVGTETIRYYNDSPDTLEQIILRLYQDVNKTGNPRDFMTPVADIHDGIALTGLAIDGRAVTKIDELERSSTNLWVPLTDSLVPGESASIRVDWSYRLSTENPLRGSGQCGDNTYFISYCYPQIAVYDDISGWDEYDYMGLAEFYNDFSSYDVSITVPGEYVVWATGLLQNPDEVLAGRYYRKYSSATTSDDIVTIVSSEDRESGGVTVDGVSNTWRFTASNVPDFTFAASADYVWDMTSLVVDRETGRRAIVGSAYDAQSRQLSNASAICKRTLEYLSFEMPAVPYPFLSMTVFQGNSAMEYPMIVNIREYPEGREWLYVATLIHEVVHSYFPFYVGTNERKYAFMDEGWAHMLPMELQTREILKIRDGFDARRWNNIGNYGSDAGMEKYDRPPAVLTADACRFDYHVANHNRPATALYFLMDMLGEETFRETTQEYMRRWNHKHPVPNDFFMTFNEVTGEDLNWYWQPWYFEFGYPDLAVDGIDESDGRREIVVRRAGNIPIPIRIKVSYTDRSECEEYRTAAVWRDGASECRIALPRGGDIARVELGDRIIPDVDMSNNVFVVVK